VPPASEPVDTAAQADIEAAKADVEAARIGAKDGLADGI